MPTQTRGSESAEPSGAASMPRATLSLEACFRIGFDNDRGAPDKSEYERIRRTYWSEDSASMPTQTRGSESAEPSGAASMPRATLTLAACFRIAFDNDRGAPDKSEYERIRRTYWSED